MIAVTTIDVNTIVYGTLLDNKGRPIKACLVQLYFRGGSELVQDTYTDFEGNWKISALTSAWSPGLYEARYVGAGLEQQLAPDGAWDLFEITTGITGTGIGVAYRGIWASGIQYHGTSQLRDIVRVQPPTVTTATYYVSKTDHRSAATWALDAADWTAFTDQFDSVATDILLAQDAAIGRSLTMGTDALGTANYGTIRSVLATSPINGNGFWLAATSDGGGYFRVGTASAGLTRGVFWDGPNNQLSIKSSYFQLKTDGNILITDIYGNTLFDSSIRLADATNITTPVYTEHATTWSHQLTAPTTDSAVPVNPDSGELSGWFFVPVGITKIFFVFNAWMRNFDNTKAVKGLVHFGTAIDFLADTWNPSTTDPDTNAIGAYNDYPSSGVGTGQPAGCFVQNTSVMLANGQVKYIQDIKVGDEVLSWNEESKNSETGTVTSIMNISSNSAFVINSRVTVTAEHPFLTRRGWVKVKDITVGDYLKKVTGDERVDTIEIVNFKEQPVYNITVSKSPTYYANGYIVHNKPAVESGTWLGPGVVVIPISIDNRRYKWRMQLEITDNPGAGAPQFAKINVKSLDIFLSRAVGAAVQSAFKVNDFTT